MKSAIAGILSCFSRQLSPDSSEVQQHIGSMHRFFDMIRIYAPESRLQLLQYVGQVFDPETALLLTEDHIPADLPLYLSRSIALYCEKEEKEKKT